MTQPDGVLVLDKAAGISSAKAIAQLKHKLSIKKIGHAGTLDPAATGILICLINRATKQAKTFEGGRKGYAGVIKLGITTDTDDLDGAVLSSSDVIPPFESVRDASRMFVGEIRQIPPVVSAIKVNGVRSYELYRAKGISASLKERVVTVDRFSVEPLSASEIAFEIHCSSVTYIRSIARDLGNALGCGASLSTLRRIASDPFTEANAKRLEEISFADLIPVSEQVLGESVCHR